MKTTNKTYPGNLILAVFGEHTKDIEFTIPDEALAVMDDVLTTVTPLEAMTIRETFQNNKSIEEITALADCESKNIEEVKMALAIGLRKLRHPSRSKLFKEYLPTLTEDQFSDLPTEDLINFLSNIGSSINE